MELPELFGFAQHQNQYWNPKHVFAIVVNVEELKIQLTDSSGLGSGLRHHQLNFANVEELGSFLKAYDKASREQGNVQEKVGPASRIASGR